MKTVGISPEKNGILLVAFGASTPVARKTLKLFEDRIRELYPKMPIRWAFTSKAVRTRMARDNRKVDSVKKALMRMAFEKYTAIAVQSLHTIPGFEYECLLEEVEEVTREQPVRAAVGSPLLCCPADIGQAAEALLAHLPEERRPDEAVLCMGHGTWHDGGRAYEALAKKIASSDSLVFVGTLEGERDVRSFLPELGKRGIKKVWLLPLLSVIGKHAVQDMAGEGEGSWRSVLVRAGFDCMPVLKGTAEYDGFVTIWTDHLQEAVKKLTTPALLG